MKKFFLALFALVMGTVVCHAQKEVRIQNTEVRKVNVLANAYVKPLTVEVKVSDKGRVTERIQLSNQDLLDLAGGTKYTTTDKEFLVEFVQNIRNFATYRVCQIHQCDMLVASTSNIRTVENGIVVEIMGFPANFVNWKTATQADYEWIEMEKDQTKSDEERREDKTDAK